MDRKFDVLFRKAKVCDSRVVPIVESARMRVRYTTFHAIWCTETGERAILRFRGASVWRVAADVHMQGLLYESFPAETLG